MRIIRAESNPEAESSMLKTGKIYKYLICMGVIVLFMLTALPDRAYSYKCGDVITDEDIAKYFDENGCSLHAVYGMPAIVGERAIPGLKKLIETKRCVNLQRLNVHIALARFGEQEGLDELERLLHVGSFSNPTAIENLAFVRNDQAVSILRTYYQSGLSQRFVDGTPFPYSPEIKIGASLWDITFIWNDPAAIGLPSALFHNLDEWNAWWNKYKDIHLKWPDFSNVSDPQLRCLARMAEWGWPEAVMQMTELPGKEKDVASILKTFQRASQRQFGTMSGTIEAVLFRLGDEAALEELTRNLSVKESYARERAIEKIRIANTKAGIEALLGAFDAKDAEIPKSELDKFRERILNALSQMVENPPLGMGAAPTPENYLKWKEWWANKKDTAILKKQPLDKVDFRRDTKR